MSENKKTTSTENKKTTSTENKKTKEETQNIDRYVNTDTGEIIEVGKDQKLLKILSEEMENKETKQKFDVHKAVARNGDLMTCKFTKKCKIAPQSSISKTNLVIVNIEDINIDRYTKRYPVLWVKNVVAIVEKEQKEDEKQRKDIDDTF